MQPEQLFVSVVAVGRAVAVDDPFSRLQAAAGARLTFGRGKLGPAEQVIVGALLLLGKGVRLSYREGVLGLARERYVKEFAIAGAPGALYLVSPVNGEPFLHLGPRPPRVLAVDLGRLGREIREELERLAEANPRWAKRHIARGGGAVSGQPTKSKKSSRVRNLRELVEEGKD